MRALFTASLSPLLDRIRGPLKDRGVEVLVAGETEAGAPGGRFHPLWVVRAGEAAGLRAVYHEPVLVVIVDQEAEGSDWEKGILRLPESVLAQQFETVWPLVEQHFLLRRNCNVLMRQVDLLKTVESLFLTQEMDKVFSQILQAINELLQTRGYSILLLRDPKRALYDMYVPAETRRRLLERPKYTFHPEFLDDILFSDKAYELIQDPNAADRKLLAIPIKGTDRGMAIAMVSVTESEIDREQLLLASRFAGQLSSVLENLQLFVETKELTLRDDLTQTYNRRYFEAFIDEELDRAKRYGSTFTIIFLDLDDLKSVNSRHGHLMGSRTLQEVAKRIITSVRNVDRVMRFGGDEFCIILPHTTTEEAFIVANRVREDIAEKPFILSAGIQVAVTASMGIASFPAHGRTKEAIIARADQAMFEAKIGRKNAVMVAKHG
jgi:diguanylate cyclase (GGDEF)-like protein